MTRSSVAFRIFSVIVLLTSALLRGAAQNPVPFLTQPLVPSAIAPVSPVIVFPLTVNGTGFVPGATVNWNGSPRYTVFSSNSRLTAYILSSDIARPTTAWITVTNPTPGGGTSNTLFLPVNRPASRLAFQRQDYYVGNMPAFSTAVDLDGNGTLDLAVPINDNGGGQVRFLLGNGDGTFRHGDTYQMGWGTVKPIFADFNRDGLLDMTLAVHSPGAMAVLLGEANGTFDLPVYYPINGAINWDVAADFNRDGKLDLASTGVSILLGNGDGTFQPNVDYPVGGTTALAVGDFNGDGNLDLVVANFGADTATVLLGNGNGTFSPAVDYPAGVCPGGVAVAELNGDGKLDFVIANQCEPSVSVLLGKGDGTFRPQVKYPTSWGAVRLDIADLNDDGRLDLVVATGGPYAEVQRGTNINTADVLLGNGDGSFQAPVSFPVASHAFDVSAYDFDRDGRADIVTSSYGENSVSVLIQR